MSAPHTPGPWRIEGSFVLDANGRAVCMMYRNERGPLRLIAAAPKLLEALDTLTLVIGLTAIKYEGQMQALQDAVDGARAALAEARGEG